MLRATAATGNASVYMYSPQATVELSLSKYLSEYQIIQT